MIIVKEKKAPKYRIFDEHFGIGIVLLNLVFNMLNKFVDLRKTSGACRICCCNAKLQFSKSI